MAIIGQFTNGANLPAAVQIPVGCINSGSGASASTYFRGDGTWGTPAGGGLTQIDSKTAAASATLDLTGIVAGYKYFILEFKDLLRSNTTPLNLSFGTGGGPTYGAAVHVYSTSSKDYAAATFAAMAQAASATVIALSDAAFNGYTTSGKLYFCDLSSSLGVKDMYGKLSWGIVGDATAGLFTDHQGLYLSSTAVTAIRISPTAGTLTSGTVVLWGAS